MLFTIAISILIYALGFTITFFVLLNFLSKDLNKDGRKEEVFIGDIYISFVMSLFSWLGLLCAWLVLKFTNTFNKYNPNEEGK